MSNFDPAHFAAYRRMTLNELLDQAYLGLPVEEREAIKDFPNGEKAKALQHRVESELRGVEMHDARIRLFNQLPEELRAAMDEDDTHPKWDDLDEQAERFIALREGVLEQWGKAEDVNVVLLWT